jgi:flagellar hook assembly protein FlgD
MPLADGAHTLEVSVLGLAKTKTFSVQNKVTLYQPLNYPNPMRDETTFFSFILSADVDRVVIAIYTVNGRKVHEMNGLAGRAGYNPAPGDPAIEWDGRDEDGDEMANGVYLYRVRAVSAGRTAEAIGKLVILRK